MNVYQGINLLELKDGRPYYLNVPQMGQDFAEVYEMLEAFRKQVEELEQRSKDSQKEKASAEAASEGESSDK